MTASPRGDGSEAPVGKVSLLGECHELEPEDRLGHRKETGQKSGSPRDNLYLMGAARFLCAREHRTL